MSNSEQRKTGEGGESEQRANVVSPVGSPGVGPFVKQITMGLPGEHSPQLRAVGVLEPVGDVNDAASNCLNPPCNFLRTNMIDTARHLQRLHHYIEDNERLTKVSFLSVVG